jgi:hypothetical protein
MFCGAPQEVFEDDQKLMLYQNKRDSSYTGSNASTIGSYEAFIAESDLPYNGSAAGYDNDKKTSKRILNLNAIKFKLNKLYSKTIRYEVIYKNLVRDLRKFYSKDFNEVTSYIQKKRKNSQLFFIECLRLYVRSNFGTKL